MTYSAKFQEGDIIHLKNKNIPSYHAMIVAAGYGERSDHYYTIMNLNSGCIYDGYKIAVEAIYERVG